MAQWDAALAAWKEAWRTAPTAPPLSSSPLSIDEALALAEEISGRIPPTPLPRPFQTPSRVEMSPFYEDPARPFFEQGGQGIQPVFLANNCDAEPFRFGVAAFLDYRQVPLRVGDSEPVAWYELLPGRQEVIPISFIAPREPGPHVYFIVQFQAPYEPMTACEWADDVVRFPWVALEDGGVTRPFFIPNMRYEPPVSAFFDRIPLLVK